jgi:hypothetical protein
MLWYGDSYRELPFFENQGFCASLPVAFYPLFYYLASRILPGDLFPLKKIGVVHS